MKLHSFVCVYVRAHVMRLRTRGLPNTLDAHRLEDADMLYLAQLMEDEELRRDAHEAQRVPLHVDAPEDLEQQLLESEAKTLEETKKICRGGLRSCVSTETASQIALSQWRATRNLESTSTLVNCGS